MSTTVSFTPNSDGKFCEYLTNGTAEDGTRVKVCFASYLQWQDVILKVKKCFECPCLGQFQLDWYNGFRPTFVGWKYIGEPTGTRGEYGETVNYVHRLIWGIEHPDDNEQCWYEDPQGDTWGVWDCTFGWQVWFSMTNQEVKAEYKCSGCGESFMVDLPHISGEASFGECKCGRSYCVFPGR